MVLSDLTSEVTNSEREPLPQRSERKLPRDHKRVTWADEVSTGKVEVEEDILRKKSEQAQDQSVETSKSEDIRRINLVHLEPAEHIECSVTVEGKTLTALIDTGAKVSLIRKTDVPNTVKFDESSTSISGLGGNSCRSLGIIELELNLHGFQAVPCQFEVVDDKDVDHPILIGRRFLAKNKLRVNPARKRLSYVNSEGHKCWEWYVPIGSGNQCQVIFSGIPCIAKEDCVVSKGQTKVIPLNVDWKHGDIMYVSEMS